MVNAILRRFELMSLSNSELPIGYKRLEYIYNPSSAYIDTGLYINHSVAASIELKVSPSSNTAWVGANAYLQMQFSRNSVGNGQSSLALSDGDIVRGVWKSPYYNLSVNNGAVITRDWSSFSKTTLLTLFYLENFSSANQKIYYCKVWINGELARDFIPVRRRSDGKVGLLDRVENKFYTSPNGANFYGSDETIPSTLEYIEEEETTNDELIDGFTVLPDGTTKEETTE